MATVTVTVPSANEAVKVLTTISKVIGFVTGLSAYSNLIPAQYVPIGVLIFGVASSLKDIVAVVTNFFNTGTTVTTESTVAPVVTPVAGSTTTTTTK